MANAAELSEIPELTNDAMASNSVTYIEAKDTANAARRQRRFSWAESLKCRFSPSSS